MVLDLSAAPRVTGAWTDEGDVPGLDNVRAHRGLAPVLFVRALLGARGGQPLRTKLSFTRYSLLTAGGLGLVAVQLALLPRWMTPRQFGLVVLGISVTQGLLQFGDLGLSRLCIDATRSPGERALLRSQGQALSLATAGLATIVAVAVGVASPDSREVAVALALGALAGAAAAADKYRAAVREVAGDEVAAAGLNFLWTNGPKVGLLVGMLAFRQASAVLAASAVVAAIFCVPHLVPLSRAWSALRVPSLWAQPFAAIVPSFILSWADTYFLSARLGVAGAGAYEALFRLLGVSTYVFLPWISVLVSRVSVAERRPVLEPLLLALAVTSVSLGLAVAFVYALAPSFFPDLPLPEEAVPGLVLYYLLLPVSYCLGSALYVRGELAALIRALLVAMVACLAGHVLFTLRGGPAEAAGVAASAMAVAVVLQARAYHRSLRPRAVDGHG